MLWGELECELAMRSGRLDGQLAAHGFAADKAGVRNLTDWFFGIDDDKGAPVALVETDDETILDWAEKTFESYHLMPS
jgi:hypothetical protein